MILSQVIRSDRDTMQTINFFFFFLQQSFHGRNHQWAIGINRIDARDKLLNQQWTVLQGLITLATALKMSAF